MTVAIPHFLRRLATGETLDAHEAQAVFGAVLDGAASDIEIASLLTALAVRGETVAEITGAAQAMRARMAPVPAPPHAIDVCGTGGDGRHTLNISTAVAFVLAGCGVPVAKHGNRAVTSRSGAADVLMALGIDIAPPMAALGPILDATNIVFLFAPNHHPGLRHAAGVRAKLGFRSIFNLLGPLANPARVKRQIIGVFDPARGAHLAQAAGALGAEHVWVVHGSGTDELTLAGENHVFAWYQGQLREFSVAPEDAGFSRAPLEAITGGDAANNATALVALLDGATGPYRDTVLLNAAAGLIVSGRADTLRQGVKMAASSLDTGLACATLAALRDATLLVRQARGMA